MLLRWWKRFLDAFLLWLAMELSWTRGHKVSPSKFYWGDLKFWKIRDLGIWIDETLQHSVNGRVIWCHSLHNFRISQIHPHYRCFLCRSSIEWKYLEIQTWEKPPKPKKKCKYDFRFFLEIGGFWLVFQMIQQSLCHHIKSRQVQ